jgi:hypothetical protein
MISKSKIALIAALAVSIASPAFAQSFNKSDGTGNELPFAYGPGGTKQTWTVVTPQNDQIAARQVAPNRFAVRQNSQNFAVRQNSQNHVAAGRGSGLYDYAAVPSGARGDASANSPALTGGGSTGYNQMVLTY